MPVTGRCYCEGVGFQIDLDGKSAQPFTAFCHCKSCRTAHAAPVYHCVYFPETAFTVTKGQDLIKEFVKPGAEVKRAFCTNCGTRVYNRMVNTPSIGTFQSLFDDDAATQDLWQPRVQLHCDDAILDLKTFLPNLPQFPGNPPAPGSKADA